MKIPLKSPRFWALNFLIFLIFSGIFFESSVFSSLEAQEVEINLALGEIPEMVISQQNTLIPLSNPANPPSPVIRKLLVIITGYSSSPWETDDDPYITAAGTWVKEGIVANNMLPIGTKIKIPELFGDKIFVVEDRMSWEKGNYQIDIWFPDYWQALNFGAKRTYIEVL
jgi:3D (Asp-Asp-Asp) domain-containing protein